LLYTTGYLTVSTVTSRIISQLLSRLAGKAELPELPEPQISTLCHVLLTLPLILEKLGLLIMK